MQLGARLGFGRDGDIYSTDHNTAVKFLTVRESFEWERSVYEVCSRRGIKKVAGHAVPDFVRADEELLAIEMEIVHPPYLLDFVSAYPARTAPRFSDEVWEEWYAEKSEQFRQSLTLAARGIGVGGVSAAHRVCAAGRKSMEYTISGGG